MKSPRLDDILILVMGMTGAGKSTFINAAAGRTMVKVVGHDLRSRTPIPQEVEIQVPLLLQEFGLEGRRVFLVNTPGFDDTYTSQVEILRRIAVWLAFSYHDRMKIAGIIFLHDISEPRMHGTTRKNFEIFRRMCGEKASLNVLLTTTKRGAIDSEQGNRSEMELKEKFWKEMLTSGSQTHRFTNTSESGLDIIRGVLQNVQRNQSEALLIQEELVDRRQRLSETEAGVMLLHTLQHLLERQRILAASAADPAEAKSIAQEIGTTLRQIKALPVPLSHRIMAYFRNM
ncbi:P-loop containing nucleoside triphosphate hydrolase protein [Mycena floridula]|nr:P-loop containing nucleoside triphosphate hydrolase protein [Mycena floridula]